MARGRLLAVFLVFACLLLAIDAPVPPAPPHARVLGEPEYAVYPLPVRLETPRVNETLEADVLNQLNDQRMAQGLAPLMPHATLQRAARAHGLDMFAHGYFSHQSLDGRTPRERVLDLGVRVQIVGENLAYAMNVTQADDALMASPPHRRNILYPDYRLIGVGVLDGGDDGVIVVEDFADAGADPLGIWWKTPMARSLPRLR
jgi:uncharacterized protein YkwD